MKRKFKNRFLSIETRHELNAVHLRKHLRKQPSPWIDKTLHQDAITLGFSALQLLTFQPLDLTLI